MAAARYFFSVNGLAYAAARSSLSAPRMTMLRALSGNGRCNALASSHGARIHTSRSSSVIRITGIALEKEGRGQSDCTSFIVETGHLPS
jgi:hypothetical protein